MIAIKRFLIVFLYFLFLCVIVYLCVCVQKQDLYLYCMYRLLPGKVQCVTSRSCVGGLFVDVPGHGWRHSGGCRAAQHANTGCSLTRRCFQVPFQLGIYYNHLRENIDIISNVFIIIIHSALFHSHVNTSQRWLVMFFFNSLKLYFYTTNDVTLLFYVFFNNN